MRSTDGWARSPSKIEMIGRVVRQQRQELPGQVAGIVVSAIYRTAYATELRVLQAEVAEPKVDVAELKRAVGV